MAQHLRESHQEEWKEMDLEQNGWKQFKVEVVKTHRSSFTRQLHEAVAIMMELGLLLNDQSVYNRFLVTTLEVKGASKESKAMQAAREEKRQAT